MLEVEGNWSHIRTIHDSYEGWVDSKMLQAISEDDLHSISGYHFVLSGGLRLADQSLMRLPRGTAIPHILSQQKKHVQIGSHRWTWDEDLQTSPVLDRSHLIDIAKGFLNTPYLWGGCSGYGIDCSGLTQRVFRMCGIQIPRDSSQQAKKGTSIVFGDHREGDLAFFAKPNKERITHVGLIVTSDIIIHSSGKVRLDGFTEKGIWNKETETFTHHLIRIQRC